MEYGKIIKQAMEIAWRKKYLWVFGFFASMGGGGGGNYNNFIDKDNASGAASGLWGNLFVCFYVQALSVAPENRHAHGCGSKPYGVISHYLPCLIHHLHLFFRIAVFKELVYVRKHVECYLVRIYIAFCLFKVQDIGCLL